MAINLIRKWSYDYIKMDCEGGKCYGVLAVRPVLSSNNADEN
jgi:serine incorporator 1/3